MSMAEDPRCIELNRQHRDLKAQYLNLIEIVQSLASIVAPQAAWKRA